MPPASSASAAIGASERGAGRPARHQAANGKFYFYDSAEDKNARSLVARLSRLFVCCCLVHSGRHSLGCVHGIYMHVNQVESLSLARRQRTRRELNSDVLLYWLLLPWLSQSEWKNMRSNNWIKLLLSSENDILYLSMQSSFCDHKSNNNS